jgi:hypothetical protein
MIHNKKKNDNKITLLFSSVFNKEGISIHKQQPKLFSQPYKSINPTKPSSRDPKLIYC